MHKETEKFGLLIYNTDNDTYNIGDYIQSIAAKDYLPHIDELINRENLNNYQGDLIKTIMNGWFLHCLDNWPPSDKVIPLFISFHLSPFAIEILNKDSNIEYFKKHEPIGCRDTYTYNLLTQKGIKAYISNCLTLTLKRERKSSGKILFVDVLAKMDSWRSRKREWKILLQRKKFFKIIFSILVAINNYKLLSKRNNILKQIFNPEILSKRIDIFHERSTLESHTKRFVVAEELIQEYCNAELVVTSRLHCALPCLAFGTPVIFINIDIDSDFDSTRINDYLNLFTKVNISNNLYYYYSNNLNNNIFSGKKLLSQFINDKI